MKITIKVDLIRKPILLSLLFFLFLPFVPCENIQYLVSDILLLFCILLRPRAPELTDLNGSDVGSISSHCKGVGSFLTRSLRPYSAAGFDPAGRPSGPSRTSRTCGRIRHSHTWFPLILLNEPFRGDPSPCLVDLWSRHRFVRTRLLLASSWLPHGPGSLGSTHVRFQERSNFCARGGYTLPLKPRSSLILSLASAFSFSALSLKSSSCFLRSSSSPSRTSLI